MKYFMGIDIGTYESKGVITDEESRVVSRHVVGHIMESPRPGRAEHDAEGVWWNDLCVISNALLEKSSLSGNDIDALGVSTIAPCCLPVDRDLNPLRKAILYGVDTRALNEITYIEELFGNDALVKKYGSGISSQSAAAKIMWIKNNEPEIYEKTYKFVTGATYLNAKLTGRFVIDKYTATAWVPLYDIKSEDWDEDTLPLFCRRDQLADLKWTGDIAGHITREASLQTGLKQGIPVSTGTADAAAEAVSASVVNPGELMIMYGSSTFMIHVTDKFITHKSICATPYIFPQTYALTAGMSTTGTLTRWFRDNFAKDLIDKGNIENINSYDLLAEEIKDVPPGSKGIIVLPYFSGERTPINDPRAKGMIFGLDLTCKRSHIYNACLEGVGFGISQHFDIFSQMGIVTRKVMAVGGGVKTRKWLSAVSDICRVPQFTVEESAGASYGDALLAAYACGFFKDTSELVKAVKIKDSIKPDADNFTIYEKQKRHYTELYKLTRNIMHEIGEN